MILQAIDDRLRARLRAVSASLCVVALGLAPVAARSSLGIGASTAALRWQLAIPASPLRWEGTAVRVARDPFAGGQDETGTRPGEAANRVAPVAALEAIATGGAPRALVQINGSVQLVGVGDTLAGARVVSIDAASVRLSSGAVLVIGQGTP